MHNCTTLWLGGPGNFVLGLSTVSRYVLVLRHRKLASDFLPFATLYHFRRHALLRGPVTYGFCGHETRICWQSSWSSEHFWEFHCFMGIDSSLHDSLLTSDLLLKTYFNVFSLTKLILNFINSKLEHSLFFI